MINILITIVAIATLLIGVAFLISPIPIGAVIIALSLSILIGVNLTVRRWFKQLRSRYRWMNKKFHQIEAKLENRFEKLRSVLLHTRPSESEEDKNTSDQSKHDQ